MGGVTVRPLFSYMSSSPRRRPSLTLPSLPQRDDVAATLLALFRLSPEQRDQVRGRALDLIQGSDRDVPVEEAAQKVLASGESSL